MIGWSLAPTSPFRDVGRCKSSFFFFAPFKAADLWKNGAMRFRGPEVYRCRSWSQAVYDVLHDWQVMKRLQASASAELKRPSKFRNQESSLDTGCCHGGDTNMDISLVILGIGKQRGDLSLAMEALGAGGRMMYHGLCTILHKNNNPLFALNNYTTLCIHNFPNITQS